MMLNMLSLAIEPVVAQNMVAELTVKGAWPGYAKGSAHAVVAVGNYAHVADGDAGLQVLNTADPMTILDLTISG